MLNLAFDGLLVMFRYFSLYGAPATVYCDSVTLIFNLCMYNNNNNN